VIRVVSIQPTPDQLFRVPLSDGSIIYFRLLFKPRIPAFFVNLEWKTFSLNGIKLANVLNLLGKFKNIPFGLNVDLTDGTEPYLIDDFTTGRATFNVWEEDDLALIAASGTGG
jgi:hypothetical protein